MTSPPIPIHCSAAMPLPPMSFGIGPVIEEVEMNTSTDQDATTVQPTVVQACSMLYDTPATLDKAEKLTAEAAGYGSRLVLFPEVFVGGYPHGSAFGLTVGSRSAKGKEDFWKYHASAIDVPEHTLVCPGGTSIISPSRAVFAGPNYEGGHLLRADLDTGEIARAKFDFDVVGHQNQQRLEDFSNFLPPEEASVDRSRPNLTTLDRFSSAASD